MAFPPPKSRKEHYRNDDKPNTGGVVWNFFKRTINIPEYRNAKDNVNPAKNRTFGGLFHDFSLSSMYRRYREWPIPLRFLQRVGIPDSRSNPVFLKPPSPTLSQRTRRDGPAARSVGASPASPLGGIRQHEQVQTAEQEQGEREHSQEAQPEEYFPCTTATMLTMTATVKAMDSQRWVCRIHLFQFNVTSSARCIVLRSPSFHDF
jgi:hypothetical protein